MLAKAEKVSGLVIVVLDFSNVYLTETDVKGSGSNMSIF